MNLEQLADIVEPAPIPWTPQTIGWWALLGLVVLTVAFVAWRVHRHRAANAYRREALRELDALAVPNAGQVNAILKRAAMVAYSRDDVAAMAGDDWSRFLGETSGAPTPPDDVAAAFADGAYSRQVPPAELIPYARKWLHSHRGAR